MNDAEYGLRKELIATCRRMNTTGINQGTSGNVSARFAAGAKKGLLISPSGVDYDELTPEDIVFMKMDGSYESDLLPSSEWRFHRDILKSRKDVQAVVHAHPTYCTALSMLGNDIPAAHYMIAASGGNTVRCANYETFGTEALSKAALKALKGRTCCLLANHGMIACGVSLRKALWLAVELETLARQYHLALQVGTPQILADDEIAMVVEKFKGYGPRSKAA